MAVGQVRAAGLRATGSGAGGAVYRFADVGALVWYLREVPWAVPGFAPAAHQPGLAALHRRAAGSRPLRARQPRFWLEAVKPPA